jgi:diguanylate cyclase (GGDEF)-like protein
MTSLPGRRVYLVDANGDLIASSQGDLPQATLTQASPGLASASEHASSGRFAASNGEQYFVSAAVAGTPWRILMSLPEAQLFKSVGGPGKWLTWLAVLGLGTAGFAVILLFDKLHGGRRQMRQLNAELERIAHTDELTGLRNRRAIEKTLEHTLSAARRHEQSFAVLMIDVDHFKRINDTLGHHGGDQVLIGVAGALSDSLRTEDVIGRWGGEEFLVVLPFTGEQGAARSAERLRKAVARRRNETPGSGPDVTVTVGLAQWSGESCDDLIARADAALYAGKAAGRNVVHTAPSLEHVRDSEPSRERADNQLSPSPAAPEPAA